MSICSAAHAAAAIQMRSTGTFCSGDISSRTTRRTIDHGAGTVSARVREAIPRMIAAVCQHPSPEEIGLEI